MSKERALRECPLDFKTIETCAIYADNHDTKECPSLPSLKVVFNDEGIPEQVEPLYFIPKRPWQNYQTNQPQGFRSQQFAQSSQNNWNPSWQPWAQPQSQSWNQGWKSPYGAYAQYQQYSPSYLPPQFLPQSNQIPQANQLPQIQVQNQKP